MVLLQFLRVIAFPGEDRGPVLEVIVSRTNFISSHTSKSVRVVGLSTALANARDLADWLGIGQVTHHCNTHTSQLSHTHLLTSQLYLLHLMQDLRYRNRFWRPSIDFIIQAIYYFSGSVLLPPLGFDMICIWFTAIQIKQEILASKSCIEFFFKS